MSAWSSAQRTPPLHKRLTGAIGSASAIAAAVLVAACLIAPSVQAEPSAGKPGIANHPALVQPAEMNSGAFLFKSQVEGRYVEAPRLGTDVEMRISGPIIRTTVTQRFMNVTDGWVEGVYVFPLPEGSAVDTLKMQIGNRFIEGKVKPREEAKVIYETAKAEGKKASLVEQERPNMFTNSVANIGPGETIIVQIEYQDTARQDKDTWSLRFPMVVAPRYNPEAGLALVSNQTGEPEIRAGADPVPDRDRISPPVLHPSFGKINPVSLRISLEAGFPLADVKSSYHPVNVSRAGDERAEIALSEGAVPADKDFELTWTAKPLTAPKVSLFRETVGSDHYVMALIAPPIQAAQTATMPREAIFVIDNSGSMAGQSMRDAKTALIAALDRLTPRDTFNVVRFDHTFELVFPEAVPASPENIIYAKGFVGRLDADGGTEMLPALSAALIDTASRDDSRLRQVIFLTDGAIGNEAQLFAEIAQKRGRSRVFTVGIGTAPNTFFMRRAAELGRGTFTHIGSETQVLARMSDLFQKLELPAMRDLSGSWVDAGRVESFPDPLPDLYVGEPIMVVAKLTEASGALRLTGQYRGERWEMTVNFAGAATRPGVAKLWARNKIASLEALRASAQTPDGIDKAIEKVALDHHLVSQRTSLVAVDITPSRPTSQGLTSVQSPLNLPEGWNFDKVFGPLGEEAQPEKLRSSFAASLQLASAQGQPVLGPRQAKRGIELPVGATPADRKILIGFLLVLLAAMSSVTWLFWRRLHVPHPVARGGARGAPRVLRG